MKTIAVLLLLASIALNAAFLTGCVTRERLFPAAEPRPAARDGDAAAALERIAGQLGIPTAGKSAFDLAGDIRFRLDHAEDVPAAIPGEEFGQILEILPDREKQRLEDYQRFITRLQGKSVIPVGGE